MTTCLGKSYSFGLPCVFFFFFLVNVNLPLCFEGGILSVRGHCLESVHGEN